MNVLQTRRNWLMALVLSAGLMGGGVALASAGPAGPTIGSQFAASQSSQATPGAVGTPGTATCIDDDEDEGREDGQQSETDTDDIQEENGADDAAEGATGADDAEDSGDDLGSTAAPGTLTGGQDRLPQATITVEQAVQTAQTAAQGTLGTVELEERDGTLVFEVTVGDQEVFVNATDGAVITVSPVQAEQDDDCADDDADHANAQPGTLIEGQDLTSQATVTLDQAIQTAQGAATGDLGVVELEDEDGSLVFVVEIGDQEVTIDAITGEVLPTEQED